MINPSYNDLACVKHPVHQSVTGEPVKRPGSSTLSRVPGVERQRVKLKYLMKGMIGFADR